MNTICKLMAVRYPRSNMSGDKSNIIELDDVNKIKPTIKWLLFNQNHDYTVVSYNDKLFICEKNGTNTYSRRDVVYHPFMNKLKL